MARCYLLSDKQVVLQAIHLQLQLFNRWLGYRTCSRKEIPTSLERTIVPTTSTRYLLYLQQLYFSHYLLLISLEILVREHGEQLFAKYVGTCLRRLLVWKGGTSMCSTRGT